MVTGREDIVSIDRAYECGATSFVTKPVNWRQLSHQLRYVLRMSRIEAQIRSARDKAEKVSTVKSALLATVRHEFRTPLTSIIGFSQMMQEGTYGPLPPKYQEFAEFISASGRHLLDSLIEMVNYAELVSESCELSDDDYRVARLIAGALESLSPAVTRRAVPVATEIIGGDVALRCDRGQITRMLRHLVENAIMHGGEKVRIAARLLATGEFSFEVSDAGPGIAPERVLACLEPFSQGDMSLARKKDGLGFGLPIVKRIAELHGGKLEIRAAEPRGALAVVSFPASRVSQFNPADAAA
jgi:signal transduction histidine kinase